MEPNHFVAVQLSSPWSERQSLGVEMLIKWLDHKIERGEPWAAVRCPECSSLLVTETRKQWDNMYYLWDNVNYKELNTILPIEIALSCSICKFKIQAFT